MLARDLVSLMPVTAYVGLFALLFFENALLPIPAELFLPLAGYYVFVKTLSWPEVLVIGTSAALLGSLVIFLLAQKFGAPVVYWGAQKIGISQATLAKNEVRLSQRYGSLLILAARFFSILGGGIVLSAAGLRMNIWRFAAISLVGSLVSTSLYLSLGYVLAPVVQTNEQALSVFITQNLAYIIGAACLAYLGYYSLRKLMHNRAKAEFMKKSVEQKARAFS